MLENSFKQQIDIIAHLKNDIYDIKISDLLDRLIKALTEMMSSLGRAPGDFFEDTNNMITKTIPGLIKKLENGFLKYDMLDQAVEFIEIICSLQKLEIEYRETTGKW